jgi:hypothetical protein
MLSYVYLLTDPTEQSLSWDTASASQEITSPYMETDDSLLCPQESKTECCPKSDECNPRCVHYFSKTHLNIIFLLANRSLPFEGKIVTELNRVQRCKYEWGRGGTALRFLNFGPRWSFSYLFTTYQHLVFRMKGKSVVYYTQFLPMQELFSWFKQEQWD